MDMSGKTLWQVGAGNKDRTYQDICLEYGVIMVGPGDPGEYNEETYSNLDNRGSIRMFYHEAQEGDIVLLRLGTNEVYGVGEIAGPAMYLDEFGDVDGWDLYHCPPGALAERRV